MNKMMKKALCLLTVATLLLTCLLCGCGGGETAATKNEASADATEGTTAPTLPDGYYVQVVDALGNPYTDGVVVQFMKDGAAAGMQKTDEQGIAAKDLADGTYTIEMMFTSADAQYHHNAAEITLTPEQKSATVTLAKKAGEQETKLTVGDKNKSAYSVETGCTYVELTKGERNYFLFAPTVAGTYEFSLPGSTATLGYYGAPHYVQEHHAGEEEIVDGKFSISIKAGMIGSGDTGTTVLVLGIDAGDNTSATLSIQRTGEPKWDVSDEPWTAYEKTVELSKYTLPKGATLKEFDLKADSYTLVLDDNGFYHLNSKDGPLVLMRLGKKSQYLDDFKTIVEKSRVGKHFFDAEGNFIKKESYNECLLEYIAVMDESEGVYPLTEDLKYIIQQRGEYYGWFDAQGDQYLFRDQNGVKLEGINAEISWLFPCCYIG